MQIIVKNKDGKEIDAIPTSLSTLEEDIKEVKQKYPPGEYHADLSMI